jgi:hypothetical protein
MKNCILYKYINRNFLKQVIVTSALISSSIIFLILTVSDVKYSIENLGYIIFSLSILSFSLIVLISSFKGRKANINNLNSLITKKEFDEVIIESTKDEFANPEKKAIEKIPYLLFFKAKGEIVFRMMFQQEDINGIYEFIKELSIKQEICFIKDNNESFNRTNNSNSLMPEVA